MTGEARLCELSSLVVDEGAERQPLHPDTEQQEGLAPLVTCFVALQDVRPAMGPTIMLPRTHTDKVAHRLLAQKLGARPTLGLPIGRPETGFPGPKSDSPPILRCDTPLGPRIARRSAHILIARAGKQEREAQLGALDGATASVCRGRAWTRPQC